MQLCGLMEETNLFYKNNDNYSIKSSKQIMPYIKNREPIFDNFKGILIFLVVYGHFLIYYSNINRDNVVTFFMVFIYIFHMPAFIFCSGFFSKSDNSKSKQSLLKLFLYYLIFNTGMMIFMYCYKGEQFHFFQPYFSYWYLLSLIYWRILISYVDIEHQTSTILKSFALALMNDYSKNLSNNFVSLRRTIVFFPFFILSSPFIKLFKTDYYFLYLHLLCYFPFY